MKQPLFSIRPLPGYAAALARGAAAFTAAQWAASALVFAPHPDDETLGCGGTLIKKCEAGANVHLAFMTDGSRSHSAFVPPAELRVRRRQEALDAAAHLGVRREAVTFLDYPDGALRRHRDAAVARITALVGALRPTQVFVPYRGDGPADHRATYAIVRRALAVTGHAADVLEYPVWIWYHWPHLPLPVYPGRTTFDLAVNSLRAGLGLRVRHAFRCAAYVGDVLPRKRSALEQHRTQMERLQPDAGWPVLGDVLDGAFLACFFQDYELFACNSAAP